MIRYWDSIANFVMQRLKVHEVVPLDNWSGYLDHETFENHTSYLVGRAGDIGHGSYILPRVGMQLARLVSEVSTYAGLNLIFDGGMCVLARGFVVGGTSLLFHDMSSRHFAGCGCLFWKEAKAQQNRRLLVFKT